MDIHLTGLETVTVNAATGHYTDDLTLFIDHWIALMCRTSTAGGVNDYAVTRSFALIALV